MDSPAATPLALAESRLRWLDRRQEVLARNVAQADTPGYRARDVTPFASHLLRAGQPAGLARTVAAHLPGTGGTGAGPADRAAPAAEAAPNGNTVSLDEQALRIAETDGAQALAMGLHRRWLGLFRTALGRNG